MAKHVWKTMSISTLYIKRFKLVPTVTVLRTYNFAFTNVHAKPFYVHENQCTQISNLSSPSSLSLCITTPLPPHLQILKIQTWHYIEICNDVQSEV